MCKSVIDLKPGSRSPLFAWTPCRNYRHETDLTDGSTRYGCSRVSAKLEMSRLSLIFGRSVSETDRWSVGWSVENKCRCRLCYLQGSAERCTKLKGASKVPEKVLKTLFSEDLSVWDISKRGKTVLSNYIFWYTTSNRLGLTSWAKFAIRYWPDCTEFANFIDDDDDGDGE